jgi:hypothetical protein
VICHTFGDSLQRVYHRLAAHGTLERLVHWHFGCFLKLRRAGDLDHTRGAPADQPNPGLWHTQTTSTLKLGRHSSAMTQWAPTVWSGLWLGCRQCVSMWFFPASVNYWQFKYEREWDERVLVRGWYRRGHAGSIDDPCSLANRPPPSWWTWAE